MPIAMIADRHDFSTTGPGATTRPLIDFSVAARGLMEGAGMTAKVSSIHMNGWFGRNDKLSMAALLSAVVNSI